MGVQGWAGGRRASDAHCTTKAPRRARIFLPKKPARPERPKARGPLALPTRRCREWRRPQRGGRVRPTAGMGGAGGTAKLLLTGGRGARGPAVRNQFFGDLADGLGPATAKEEGGETPILGPSGQHTKNGGGVREQKTGGGTGGFCAQLTGSPDLGEHPGPHGKGRKKKKKAGIAGGDIAVFGGQFFFRGLRAVFGGSERPPAWAGLRPGR